jgi:DUF4097 and DUF4098 domain-containing protein YvlB
MKHVFLTTTFAICLFALTVINVCAQDKLHKTYPLNPNGTVSVHNISGYIRITGWNENRVQVDAVKRGNQDDFSQVEIRVTDSPDRLEINTIYPRGFGRGRNQVEVNYELKVPRSAILNPITSTSGNITIFDAGARVAARTTSGDITLRGISGDASISSTSGNISAERMGGILTVSSTSGDLRISDVAARVSAHATSGNLTALDLHDDISAIATSGDIRIEKVRGRASAQANSGKVWVREVGGDANLQCISDTVSAENIKGRLTVSAVSADVSVRNVQEGVRVNSVSGTIIITNTKGLIEARTTSGDIGVREVESRDVQLNTHSGTISYDGSIFDNGRYTFESFSGAVLVLIPTNASFTVTASTFNGSIETDFPLTIPPGTTQTNRPKRLQGTHGTGEAQIKANGFSADIKLKKK